MLSCEFRSNGLYSGSAILLLRGYFDGLPYLKSFSLSSASWNILNFFIDGFLACFLGVIGLEFLISL